MSRSIGVHKHDIDTGKLQLTIDPSLEGCILGYRDSTTRDGTAMIANIVARIPLDKEPLELLLQPFEPIAVRRFYSDSLRIEHIEEVITYIDNTIVREGVNVDNPFGCFKRRLSKPFLVFTPGKLTFSVAFAAIVGMLQFNVFYVVLPFTLIAILDFVVGLVPKIHPPDTKRTATMISRAWEYFVSNCMLLAAGSIQYIIINLKFNWFEKIGISIFPAVFVGMVLTGYATRLFGGFMAVRYGSNKNKAQSKYVKLIPSKRLRTFFGDKDFTG